VAVQAVAEEAVLPVGPVATIVQVVAVGSEQAQAQPSHAAAQAVVGVRAEPVVDAVSEEPRQVRHPRQQPLLSQAKPFRCSKEPAPFRASPSRQDHRRILRPES
jgi:hypothetical protein